MDIDAYKIKIRGKDGVFYEQSVYCDGSKQPVLGDLFCLVPMVALRTSPYNLEYLDAVIAKISARNARGWSADYPLNDQLTAP